jgi:hypothetical protein
MTMAWKEACELEAIALIKNKVKKEKKKIRPAMIEAAKETGIPFKTLNRWYYHTPTPKPKKYLKNEVVLVRKVTTIDNGQKSKFEIEINDINDERFMIIQEFKPKRLSGSDETEFRPTLNRVKIPKELVEDFQAFFMDLKEEDMEAEPETASMETVPTAGAPPPE